MQVASDMSLFVSDLHLGPGRPTITAAFLDFLGRDARGAGSLYILGDLFDYWIGDDDLDDPLHRQVASALADLSRRGCTVRVMHGNRDFLLGERFCKAAGVTLLPDPSIVMAGGVRTLLLHGDTLCLDDLDYQAFRAQVRDAGWQEAFLAKPIEQRRVIAQGLRADSRTSQQAKTQTIMNVAERAVIEAFRSSGCERMIHGHTHRPARHEHVVDGRTCERWVLADWHARGSCLRVDGNGVCTPLLLAPG